MNCVFNKNLKNPIVESVAYRLLCAGCYLVCRKQASAAQLSSISHHYRGTDSPIELNHVTSFLQKPLQV